MSRSLSGAVDLGVVAALLVATYFGAAGVLLLWDPRSAHLPDPPRAAVVNAAMVLMVGYLAAAWTTTGRTYGSRLLGLRVVDSRGGRLHLARALLRALLCVAFPVGLLWAAVSRANRSVADVVLRTSVVYDWGVHRPLR
ncbi:MAG: RDD family protein [Actinomycetes bacterium]